MGRRADIKSLPDLNRLNELFIYEPATGNLRWKTIPANFKRAKVGDLVGTIGAKGYRVVGISRVYYLVHRIIWKMMTGQEPSDQIDHRDGDKTNNRWRNLREATNGQNRWNTRLQKNNTSGVKGVSWDAKRQVWTASINKTRIGRFKSKDAAIAARLKAAEELHGQFLRVA